MDHSAPYLSEQQLNHLHNHHLQNPTNPTGLSAPLVSPTSLADSTYALPSSSSSASSTSASSSASGVSFFPLCQLELATGDEDLRLESFSGTKSE